MNSKRPGSLVVVAGSLLFVATAANASHRSHERQYSGRYDNSPTVVYARVSHVEPLIERVQAQVPVRECYETVAYDQPAYPPRTGSRVGGTIVGGVIGGVLGDQFGGGDGRQAMRLFGTLVGAAIGNDAAARRNAAYYPQAASAGRPVQECTTRYETRIEERTRGYRVAYIYEGREYITETATPPGDRIPVEVSVRPAF